MDINQMEKQIKSITFNNDSNQSKSCVNRSSILESFASLTEDGNLTDSKVLGFLKELLSKIDDRKVNIEDF